MEMAPALDRLLERVGAGERLSAAEIADLAATPDILALGMMADTVRRRLHGTRVTYLRVAGCAFDASFAECVPPAAREIRIGGAPGTLAVAVAAVRSARAIAGERTVSGFSWPDVEALAARGRTALPDALRELRAAGLDALAEVPIDGVTDLDAVVAVLAETGFERLRLTCAQAPPAERTALLLRAAAAQDRAGGIHVLNPLPTVVTSARPTTGYEDVKAVALARLAAPNIPTIQVDWLRYGPKLAQVALTFGADDLDNVTASDAAPDGHRRAPVQEVRRNIEAAALSPAERDGRFNVI
ncbi:MAG: hypothetical protein A3F70_15210 [Acidobacteria bacterium RIFCSPLOWO2_12_FULL_67_14]|nr:MAG: hypothetical protein A3H29_11950 [Acidobacteria bacterium RIFCSPLOWO2_02_FULL_67_21]OFW35836.1 MAG: hypothetical protein A3F70_15210 [Acidobacteria bacterium RIFCSPLOWO2_12_FULL_67_14]